MSALFLSELALPYLIPAVVPSSPQWHGMKMCVRCRRLLCWGKYYAIKLALSGPTCWCAPRRNHQHFTTPCTLTRTHTPFSTCICVLQLHKPKFKKLTVIFLALVPLMKTSQSAETLGTTTPGYRYLLTSAAVPHVLGALEATCPPLGGMQPCSRGVTRFWRSRRRGPRLALLHHPGPRPAPPCVPRAPSSLFLCFLLCWVRLGQLLRASPLVFPGC